MSTLAPGANPYNVRDYGALGDIRSVGDAQMAANSPQLISGTASFVYADVDKGVTVVGAGPSGANLVTTIAEILSNSVAVLAMSAATAVTQATATIATDDGPGFQRAINAASADGSNAIQIPPGTYSIQTTIAPKSNVSWIGSGRNVTTLHLDGAAQSLTLTGSTLANVMVDGITFDANHLGSNLLWMGPQNKDIAIRHCAFVNCVRNSAIVINGISMGWSVAVGTTAGAIQNGGTNVASDNIQFTDNIIGPDASYYESCGFEYCANLKIIGNTFSYTQPNGAGTGLAVYGYCRNVVIAGNTFLSNNIDLYVQQSDTISITGNTFTKVAGAAGSCVGLFNVKSVGVVGNQFWDQAGVNVGIIVDDQLDLSLTTFNANAVLYAASKDLAIKGNSLTGFFKSIYAYGVPMPSSPNQVSVNNFTDVLIEGNTIDGITGYGIQIGGPNAQNIQRVRVLNNHLGGGTFPGGASVLVQGSPAYAGTNTAQGITGQAGIKQTVAVTSSTGIVSGQWLSIDTSTSQEDVYVYTVPDGTHIQAVFAKTHSSGVAVAASSTIITHGANDIEVSGNKCQPSTAGNSSGIIAWDAQLVKAFTNDLSNAASGTGSAIALAGAGSLHTARSNLGYNPRAALAATPAVPTSGTAQQNTTGVDVLVNLAGGTVTAINVTDAAGANSKLMSATTPCSVIVPSRASITITYSVVPSWGWYGL